MVQGFRIVSEQLFPYWTGEGKESQTAKGKWQTIHDKLSMELGVKVLSPMFIRTHRYTPMEICENFISLAFDGSIDPDHFIKNRISFLELAFRQKFEDVGEANSKLPAELLEAKRYEAGRRSRSLIVPGDPVAGVRARNALHNKKYDDSAAELNTRMQAAGYPLNYHNGFIQITADQLTGSEIDEPFWKLVVSPKWRNVDQEMKEAIDIRDGGLSNPEFHAAKALESTVKIISDDKGWTTGSERGAHNFIDNLGSKKNGEFIERWESESLKRFFSDVRNPEGHGAGSGAALKLGPEQTDWAIEFCMIWIKSLVRRHI